MESDHEDSSSSSCQLIGDPHDGDNQGSNPAPHLRPNSHSHKVELSEHLRPQESPHNAEEVSPINTLLDMGYPQHMIDRLGPCLNKDIPTLVDEMDKMYREQKEDKEVKEHKNPYLDKNVMRIQEEQFSTTDNQRFVQSHEVSGDDNNESCASSSSQQMVNDVENKQDIQHNANEHGNEVYDDDDDELRLDDLIPQCCKEIFDLIAAREDIELIKTKMEKYSVLNRNHSSETDHDWNDFRYISDEDEDGVTILEHAFNALHYGFCIYLVTEMKLLPFIYCEHIIRRLISKIKQDFNKHRNDNELESVYCNVMKQMISELRPPTDKQFKDSFNIFKDLLRASFTLESKFLCKMIKDLLEETFAEKECFVDTLRDKLNEILCIVRDCGSKCNDSHKRQVWNVLFEYIIYRKRNMDWITALTNHWKQWIFKDWTIFEVILSKVDRFDEEYRRLNPDVNDIRSLLWNIMNCVDHNTNKPNMNGTILICNYIYEYKQSESFSKFINDELNDIIMAIIADTNFSRKVKHKYVSILFYFFVDIAKAIDYQRSILSTAVQKYLRLEANDQESVKMLDTMLYNIFIMHMLRFSKGYKVNKDDCWEHVNKEEKQVIHWSENVKIENATLKHVIQGIISRCLAICKTAKRERYIEQHCNVIIQFALKLSKFAQNKEMNAQNIISQIFSDVDHDRNEFNYSACHQLQTFVYQIAPNYFQSRMLENVHVVFLIQNQASSIEEKSNMNDGDGNELANIHLMNISIVSGMKPKQICQFILSCLRIRYKKNTSYNSPHMKYDALHYKLWSKSRWKAIRYSDALHRNKEGKASVLLITNNEDISTPLSIMLGHIHHYALMSLRTGDEVFYFDRPEVGNKRNIWLRGNVKEIKRSKDDKMFDMITIENNDSKDRMFANNTNENKYFFDILDVKNPCFQHIIPSILKHWFPVSYFTPYDRECSWQTPQFCFISAIIPCPVSELFMGQIKHHQEDKYRGTINIINGEMPYPPDQLQFVKLDIASKLDFDTFVDHHYNKIDTERDMNVKQKYVWSVYVHWNGQSLHENLVSDMDNIYCMECNFCVMYLLTAQHLHRITETKSINFDFLRYGRECSMDRDCFVLTVFEEQHKYTYYSSLLKERFATVYCKDLESLCPQQFAYSFPNYPIRKKKKKKNEKNRNDKHVPSYSKQKHKKKKADELIKDWDWAMDLIEQWAKKNKNSMPRDTEAWEAVIRSQIMKDLYPYFKGQEDVEQLAIRAASIDVDKFNKPDPSSAKVKSQQKQEPPHYQPRQAPPQTYAQQQQQVSPPHYPARQRNPPSKNLDSSAPFQSQQKEEPEYIPHQKKNNHNPMNHSSFNQHSQSSPAQVDDSQSTQSIHSSHSVANHLDYNTNKIPVCVVKPVRMESYRHLAPEEQQKYITHGFLVGCPENVDDGQDITQHFRTIEANCEVFGLRVSSGKFVYVENHETLAIYSENVNETTLFFYVRFTGREHAMNFDQMDKGLLGLRVKVPVKKIKKIVGHKPYCRYSSTELKEMANLVSINGNGAKRNYHSLMDSLIEHMYKLEDNHIENRMAHDYITVPTKEWLMMNDEWGVPKEQRVKLPMRDSEHKEEAKCSPNNGNDAPHTKVMSHQNNNNDTEDRDVYNGHNRELPSEGCICNDDKWDSLIATFKSLAKVDFAKLAQEMEEMKKENKILKQRLDANK